MLIRRSLPIALLFVLLLRLPSAAQDKSVNPGINDPFQNPDVKAYVDKFEVESREVYAERKAIVAACKLTSGMVVADVGAGTGLFTRLFAAEVGPKGKVYAVDIAPAFIEHIRKSCKEAGLSNVEPMRCSDKSVELPANSVDVVFICDTYHHFEFPQLTLASIHKALKPGGQLVLIDFHRIEGKSSKWVLGHVRAGQEVFTKEITDAGFRLAGQEQLLKENYFLRFDKVSPPAGKGAGAKGSGAAGACWLPLSNVLPLRRPGGSADEARWHGPVFDGL
jgi:predicted methyltransferase